MPVTDLLHSNKTQMALALGRLGKPVYPGSVSHADVAKRRKRNRVARTSRQVNRGNR